MSTVAVTSMVPRHHSPASGCKQGSKYIERSGEVRPTMDQKEHRVSLCTPFIDSNVDTIGVMTIVAVWSASARVGTGLGIHRIYRLRQ
jgi:hypothetical protein